MSNKQALLFGASGAIGGALVQRLAEHYNITAVVREQPKHTLDHIDHLILSDFSESSLISAKTALQDKRSCFDLIFNGIGTLHNNVIKPEKRLSELSPDHLQTYFQINTIVPALLIKHFYSLMPKSSPAVFATLSAKVGSISDNYLGGWYGYRVSKAALNMLVKTASIEIVRTHKSAAVIAIHPGTTISYLSEPYTKNTPADKLFTPDVTAERLCKVLGSVTAEDNGCFFDWSGEKLPW